jgi:hypothetical protein
MAKASVVLVVYRHHFSPWWLAAAQVLTCTALVAPVFALRVPLREPVSRPRHLIVVAAGLVALVAAVRTIALGRPAGCAARQVIRFPATGVGEDVL